ncbi:PTS system N-acetylglucosamine-specific IIC component [Streptosporangium becharense]|uniref:PTS system N-acetylglucosamine-specific IIC component n=1 Tax=Streptosporangium becharense TaxID=1816182 RepID=A0A7W9IEP8_9ACTN|nr:PTS transporter subunit EIIC [Streptosporangium becharense]MBB2909737.1 PTS system N-acetylglucosamine-specific IIC component [Streptosporangium becharense]MBB5819307.1 PTS system N-acetylglucosamine-specific IIC component [Streptosporangium becharense]
MSTAAAERGPSVWSSAFAVLQRVGRSLMMPIAVLPAAGLLLRFGQEDLLGRTDNAFLDQVAGIFAAAGGALFDNLPLLFAIGVAIGFARKADGSTALAALVGYLVFDRVSRTVFFTAAPESEVYKKVTQNVVGPDGQAVPTLNLGVQNPTGVLGGIVIGITAALLWQRYYRFKPPSWLAFFGGRRFVPIVTAVVALLLGVLFGLLWRPVGDWLAGVGDWLSVHGTLGAGVYGVANRLLIPIGLHHFLNTIVWFTLPECQAGVDGATRNAAGDLNCYFAGQEGAGIFMTGFFPVMMFGLLGAAIAIWRAAPPHRRPAVGGIMLSAGLTAFVTGITEPIEFAFVFVAPALFVVHALLTGLSMALMAEFGARLGFTFSAGAIDMLLNAGKANTRGLGLIIGYGVLYFVIYYLLFTFMIRKFGLATPGREPEDAETPIGTSGTGTASGTGTLPDTPGTSGTGSGAGTTSAEPPPGRTGTPQDGPETGPATS